jgi:hypothetical protein
LSDFEAITRGKPSSETLKAFNLTSQTWVDIAPEIYRDLRITGGSQGNGGEIDSLGARPSENGQLAITIAGHSLPVGHPLPASLRFSPRQAPRLLLSNSHFMALTDYTLVPGRSSLRFRMLDRRTNTWAHVDIPGDESWNVRAFGQWMAGIVDESLRKKTFRLSPGRHKVDPNAYRRGVIDYTVDTIDNYLEIEEIYRTGRLFLYDIETRRYYEWDTHDGDCEILLVEGGDVYYRVDQSIYRAHIGSKTLDAPELLVESAAVPHIHWAFFGPRDASVAKPDGK